MAYHNLKKSNQVIVKPMAGFTLIELMVVIIIVGILAAIAIPSYRQYVIKNAEDEAKAQMQSIALQLDRWRASQLSYKGFNPQNVNKKTGKPEYRYDNSVNTEINIPLGSSGDEIRYTITLVDGGNTSKSLVPSTKGKGKAVDATVARSWKMLATPQPNSVAKTGHTFMMTSTGLRCQSKDTSITISSDNCGTTSEAW